VRLDQLTGRLTGREVVTIRNPSDSAIKQLVIRLYQNRFDPMSPRSRVPPSVTTGQTLYKVVVDGTDIDTKVAAANWTTGTIVNIPLPKPIAAGGTSTVEIEWAGDIPDIPIGRGAARGGRRGCGCSSWRSGIPRWRSMTTCAGGIASRTWVGASSTTTTAGSR
jgi:hypothetical protein